MRKIWLCLFFLWVIMLRHVYADISEKRVDISSNKVWRVAIVDRFYSAYDNSDLSFLHRHMLNGVLDLDDDETPEPLYHGDIVQIIASHPRFIFLQYPLGYTRRPLLSIYRQLKQIRANSEQLRVDALILSWESSTLISTFGQTLNPEHLTAYKQQIEQWGESESVWKETADIIAELERLSQQGIRVYTIAGNGGKNMVNTFSFAQGVITVGATEKELAHFVSDNALVDIYANAAYQPVRIDDKNGLPLGYDLNNDHCIDIPVRKLTGYTEGQVFLSKKSWQVLKGSSFAAPAALKRALVPDEVQCQPAEI